MDTVAQIVRAVLYEGYVLWPYRRSAPKNQQRWTFGGVFPRGWSEARGGDDAWWMQTECLLEGDASTRVDVAVRFLHVVRRQAALEGLGGLEPVDEVEAAGQHHLTWEESVEREVVLAHLRPDAPGPYVESIDVPAGEATEWLSTAPGEPRAALMRSWCGLRGAVGATFAPAGPGLFRLRVRIINTTPWEGGDRDRALRHTFASTHTVLRARRGGFVSLTDPPARLADEAARCENRGAWPVLVGEEGSRDTVLSSFMILPDHPQVATESPGDLFDGGEIDQLLILNVLSLSDEEKREVRATDPRAREILDRCESLSPEQLMRLHGVARELRPA